MILKFEQVRTKKAIPLKTCLLLSMQKFIKLNSGDDLNLDELEEKGLNFELLRLHGLELGYEQWNELMEVIDTYYLTGKELKLFFDIYDNDVRLMEFVMTGGIANFAMKAKINEWLMENLKDGE